MARKKTHEEHTNHEAWAIPYGDLLTLLLALFVVLYSMSSVNEGKYRVLSESLNEAFGGRQHARTPVEIGDQAPHEVAPPAPRLVVMPASGNSTGVSPKPETPPGRKPIEVLKPPASPAARLPDDSAVLKQMADSVQKAMGDLIDRHMVVVRRTDQWLEIEIRTDILFPSGVAEIAHGAIPVLTQLAGILKPYPNAVRVEGYTDDRPISTIAFPSNWQLSAGRAASVVKLFMESGVDPRRMSVAGFAEFHPVASNDTAEGRNRNRRVLIVVLGDSSSIRSAALADAGRAPEPTAPSPAGATTPAAAGDPP